MPESGTIDHTADADSKLRVRRLTGTLGAELTGFDLANAGADEVEALRQATIAHRVVVVRDQFLEPEGVLHFGRRLGPFVQTVGLETDPNYPPEIHTVTNPGKANTITESWHSDATTSERPPVFTILAAKVVPEAGGDTLFADMIDAYETLSPKFREMLRGLRVHHANHMFTKDTLIEAWHPLIRTIPETGERAIYGVFPHIVEGIDGLTKSEAHAITEYLFEHATRPDRMYRHRWQPGDVLIWDNRSTIHYAVHDHGDAERTMIRLMIEGERPFEAPY